MSDSLWPHGLQHARLPCPSASPWACSESCPLSRWCHPTISSSVIPFSSCLQSFQHQGLFQWVDSSHQVSKVLDLQLQHQSFQWIFRLILFRIDCLDFLAAQRVSQAPQLENINLWLSCCTWTSVNLTLASHLCLHHPYLSTNFLFLREDFYVLL